MGGSLARTGAVSVAPPSGSRSLRTPFISSPGEEVVHLLGRERGLLGDWDILQACRLRWPPPRLKSQW